MLEVTAKWVAAQSTQTRHPIPYATLGGTARCATAAGSGSLHVPL